ncbi:MAG: MYG1 family protein [Desulfuromonadales bacterium]|nr:MYG1 family protein [Desulfuromonadales bacterium]
MYKIVAHPGSAHKDDFLSVCVLLSALGHADVFRREATGEDLADPQTYVVDVGMEYDPQRHNFDHHQDPSLPCAFHLVMKHLGHHDTAMLMFEWYGHMSMMDVSGPHRTAEHLGIDTSVLFASSSPIDGYILARFSALTSLDRQDMLYELMKELGQNLIAMMEQKMERLARLKEEAGIVKVKHLKAIISTIADNPKLAMDRYLKFLNDDRIVMSITPSVRGAGWEMLRLGNNKMVDFRALAGNPDVRFIHANGFVAKTCSLIPQEAVIELAARAISDVVAEPTKNI